MTREQVILECAANHRWIGEPMYCDFCGVDKGEQLND